MRSFQKKGKLKYMMQSKPFLVLFGIIILAFFYSTFSFMNKMEETRRNRKIIEDKIAELEKSKETFNSEITKLKTEKGIEESIREKFGVAKEGENMIMIIEDKNEKKIEEKTSIGGFFGFLKKLFNK